MASEKVEAAILDMQNLYTDKDRLAYLHKLPTGMSARVVGEIFERARIEESREFFRREFREDVRRWGETSGRPWNPYNPWAYENN